MRRAAGDRGGFALVAVLLVLLALLVLATPLLLSARSADQASTRLADRAETRIALDAAARHARLVLSDSYPSADLDRTPYHDTIEEATVHSRFPPDFLDAHDPSGVMWDVEARDVAGLIDLDSANPHVLANLMGLSARLSTVVPSEAKEIPLSSAANLEPQGFVWIAGEIVRYTKIVDGTLIEFTRGVLGPAQGTEWRGGPRPPGSHGIGTPVLDQRALAPVLWRMASPDGEARAFESLERLTESARFALAAALDPAGPAILRESLLGPLRRFGSVHAGVRGGPRWQRAARLTQAVEAARDGRLRVDDPRWFNPGATLRVRDGETSELALVQSVSGNGEIVLDRLLQNEYRPYEAVVEVLARRPVNLNTARREVLEALFLNLQIAGRNSRVTGDEATALAALVIESRPLTGFEDFLRRVVLPAAGIEKLPSDAPVQPESLRDAEAFLDPWDAVAVYMNGLNANDAGLLWSTMPYAFTSRDVYALELRASVNAPSGVQRFAAVREDVSSMVPQRELIRLWARQEDFDEELRLSGDAPWWQTGPESTSRWDGGTVPPSRLWAQMGTAEGHVWIPGVSDPSTFADRDSQPTPEHVFPSRENQAWAQLMPTRLEETQRLNGRVAHFDHETRDPEGRYLPDGPLRRATDDNQVQWTTAGTPLMRPAAFSLWVRPRSLGDGLLLDVMGTSREVDRTTLGFEGGDLVLRVLDGVGDHPGTTEKEAGELRYSLSEPPGLPADVWTHVEIDVGGNRPSQMHMLVNGLAHGVRTPGLTRLTGSVSQNVSTIPVESVEGFPPRCVVRIGNELLEVTVQGGGLSATRVDTGEWAGFGGRMARERALALEEDQASPPADLTTLSTDHAAGTPVERYGYSLPLASDVPTGSVPLARDLGRFRVAMLAGVEGVPDPFGEPVTIGLTGFTAGGGLKGANSMVTGLVLRCADDGDDPSGITPPEEFMTAFHPDGGYAVIVQSLWTFNGGQAQDTDGAALGGLEVVRYSGWSGNTLTLAERGLGAAELPNLGNLAQGQNAVIGGSRSFIVNWNTAIVNQAGQPWATRLNLRTFVVPISLSVRGASDVRGFLAAKAGESQFAQLTHVSDAENTEWVRYDWFQTTSGQLVRDDPNALVNGVYGVLTRGVRAQTTTPTPPVLDDFGPGTHGVLLDPGPALSFAAAAAPAAAAPPPAQTYAQSQWDPRVGKNENPEADWPLTRAVETWFQFRGVFGTFSHVHPAGTPVLPVFYCRANAFDGGRPGRKDTVFLVGSDPTHPGWPLTVHRAHVPALRHAVRDWDQATGDPATAIPIVPREPLQPYDGYLLGRCFVALETRSPENVLAGTSVQGSTVPVVDARLVARLVSFPSGERPRAVSRAQVGGAVDGSGGAVPSAVVDEIAFGDAQFGRATPGLEPESMAGAGLILAADVDDGATDLLVYPMAVRIAMSRIDAVHDYLADLPPNGGLLRLGDEIVAYRSYDASGGTVQLAQDGRGRLGTRAQAHETHDPIQFLEHRVATVLTAPLGAGDSMLAVANTTGFPSEGLVLVGDELIHYTRLRGSALEMPRSSSVAGRMDGRGEGLFRGRFGTIPAAHAAGDAVILFPVRYPDRWARRADAPELAYFGFGVDQPAAFWGSVFFAKQDTDSARIGLLQRTDPEAPWDADPDKDARVGILWQGEREGQAVRVGKQSDRLQWRAFVEYQAGAFDARTGLGHGWRQTPRLTMLSAFYHAPPMTYRSVER